MPETPLIDIHPDHWAIVQAILHKHVPQHEVWAFGSRAKWLAKEHSDLDLAIITDKALPLDVYASLSDDFSESDLPYRVDIVDWATTSESFRKIIERDKVVVQHGKKSLGMGGEWPLVQLGTLVTNLDSRRVPLSSRERARRHGSFPYYGATGVMDFIDDYIFDGLHLLIAEDGSVEKPDGKPFLQLVNGKFWVNNHAHVLKGATDEETKYLYYALSTIDIRPFISGSVQAKLSQANLNKIPIPYPEDRDERRAIAHILGTLDDKIELLRRQNETLEAMARALFKAWFVDFEPVRAKMEGRWQRGQSLPGLPAHLYDLFPDRLVKSELGEIPEGWEVKRVADIGKVICGKTPSTRRQDYYGDDIPFITIPDMHGKVFVVTTQKNLSHIGAASQQNKTIPRNAICVSCIATPGLVVITSEAAQTNQQINSVIPTNGEQTFFWYWVLRELGDEIRAFGSGGSVLFNMSTGRFADLSVLAPAQELRSYYHSQVAPLFEGILANEREIIALATLRDTLLPKLISGELRVKDAEAFLKERGL